MNIADILYKLCFTFKIGRSRTILKPRHSVFESFIILKFHLITYETHVQFVRDPYSDTNI